MTEILAQSHIIRSEQVDVQRILKPSSLLLMLQEIALDHCRMLGLGSEATLNRDLLWVVTRYYVEIERMPAYEEQVTLETWPGPMRRVLFPRYFRMKDKDGNILFRASSVWVLIDGKERKMITPKAFGLEPVEGLVVGDELPYNMPAKVLPETGEGSFSVPYSYLDLNGHMNNTRYLDVCFDLIADEAEGKSLTAISAEFQNEIHYRETVSVKIGSEGNDYTFTGMTERPCFRIGMSFLSKGEAK